MQSSAAADAWAGAGRVRPLIRSAVPTVAASKLRGHDLYAMNQSSNLGLIIATKCSMAVADKSLKSIAQAQRDRLAFIDLSLRFCGEIRRQELIDRFDIQAAAATRDISLYRALAASNLEYDSKNKIYVRTAWFRPLFTFPAARVLAWLSQGYGANEPVVSRGALPHEGSHLPGNVNLELLSVLTRAIRHGSAVEIGYRSLSRGLTTREIAPFALADNGWRWHVRAFDRRHGEFRDFVLARLTDARLLDRAVDEREAPECDIQWSRIAELQLVPHPANVRHPDTVEAEYGMANGALIVQTRAAMAGYLLRRWNVDCTTDHRLRGDEYQLWLRNPQTLYGITNLNLAPGYQPDRRED